MNPNRAYIPSSFIEILIQYLDERQLAATPLRQVLNAHAQGQRIEAHIFFALLEQIYPLDPFPALGLRIGGVAKPQNFGLVGYLLTSCSSLRQALIRYGRFQTLVLTDLKCKIEVKDDAVSHQWMLLGADSPMAYEFSAAIFIRLYQSLINRKVAPVRVGLPFPKPSNTEIYTAILGCPVEFDSPSLTVDIPTQLMLLNISTSDPYLLRIFNDQAEALLNKEQHTDESFSQFLKQLQQQLLIAMNDGDTRASSVCEKMGYSLRSFYRKLSENGHSYRSVLADSRRRLSKGYLADSALSCSEVALLLGYSEQSAFIRAFKDWMGITPGEYRHSLVQRQTK